MVTGNPKFGGMPRCAWGGVTALPIPKPWVTSSATVAPGPGRPWSTTLRIDTYVVLVMLVGLVPSFSVNVAAVVLPSSFFAVAVVPATLHSASIC